MSTRSKYFLFTSWLVLPLVLGCGDDGQRGQESCQFPTFARASEPLKTTDAGQCDRDLALAFGGDCENFHWLGLIGDPFVLYDGDKFRMWFTGGEQVGDLMTSPMWQPGIVIAESADGILWQDPKNLQSDVVPVLRPGTAGIDETGVETAAVVKNGDDTYLYYTGDRAVSPSSVHVIGLATSQDGANFQKHPTPVLSATLPWEQPFDAGGFEVGGVLEPSVIIEDGVWRLWYQAFGREGTGLDYSRFGYAESSDGIQWSKRAEPIFRGQLGTFEALGVAHTNVVKDPRGGYHLFYVGIGTDENLRMGHAFSNDGLVWDRNPKNPIIEGVMGSFDAGLAGGPSAVFVGDTIYLFYMGTPKPDFSEPTRFALSIGSCE